MEAEAGSTGEEESSLLDELRLQANYPPFVTVEHPFIYDLLGYWRLCHVNPRYGRVGISSVVNRSSRRSLALCGSLQPAPRLSRISSRTSSRRRTRRSQRLA